MLPTVNPKPVLLAKCFWTVNTAVIATKSCKVWDWSHLLSSSKWLVGSVRASVVVDCAVAGLAQWLHTPDGCMELTEEVIRGSQCS